MLYKTNQKILFKIIIGFRTGFSALLLNILKKKIYKLQFSQDWNFYIEIKIKYFYLLCLFLKKHCLLNFSLLIDFFCYENKGHNYKYIMFYTLLSYNLNSRLNIKTKLPFSNNIKILSLMSVYLNSSWAEREIFEFYGIYFYLNKDLRRLLLDYGFRGYPLRKDFPLTGFIELYYDDSTKKIVYEKVNLNIDYKKNFFFKSM